MQLVVDNLDILMEPEQDLGQNQSNNNNNNNNNNQPQNPPVINQPVQVQRQRSSLVLRRPQPQIQPPVYRDPRDIFVDSPADLAPQVLRCIDFIDYYSQRGAECDNQRIQKIFGQKYLEIYAGGRTPTANPKTVARRAFLEALANHFSTCELPCGVANNSKTIKLSELVGGSKIVTLFQEALDEELKSPWYRDAVVLHGISNYAGTAKPLLWQRAKHFIVGGSSGAGKTFGAKRILLAIDLCVRFEVKYKVPNTELRVQDALFVQATKTGIKQLTPATRVETIVSVDGGDARAVSQMRGIVLQCALALGYKGIEDLQSKTGKMDFKDAIKNAAKYSRVHVVEPRTFATSDEAFEKVLKEPERTIFCMVHTPPEAIQVQGDTRAWYNFKDKDNLTRKLYPIRPNNRDIGCESKAYSKWGRPFGRVKSKGAMKKFLGMQTAKGKIPLCVELMNNAQRISSTEVSYAEPSLVWVYIGDFEQDSLINGYEVDNPLKSLTPKQVVEKGLASWTYKDKEEKKVVAQVVRFQDKYCVIYPGVPFKKK
jgi:hypothetical protein